MTASLTTSLSWPVVILRRALLENVPPGLPEYFDYRAHVAAGSQAIWEYAVRMIDDAVAAGHLAPAPRPPGT